jgi:hypothetical protein
MPVDGSCVLAEPDPQKISTITHWLMEIYHIILARMGLGSNVKLNVIELEDQIQRYVLGAAKDFMLLCCCKV